MHIALAHISHRTRRRAARAFTLVEILVVVVVLSILAAFVVPQLGVATANAEIGGAKAALATLRTGIASHRASTALSGAAPYPTLAQLTTADLIVTGDLPVNPFKRTNSVQSVTLAQANARAVVNNTVGWNYHVDNSSNPPRAIIYLNSNDTVTNAAGQQVPASHL